MTTPLRRWRARSRRDNLHGDAGGDGVGEAVLVGVPRVMKGPVGNGTEDVLDIALIGVAGVKVIQGVRRVILGEKSHGEQDDEADVALDRELPELPAEKMESASLSASDSESESEELANAARSVRRVRSAESRARVERAMVARNAVRISTSMGASISSV